MVGLKHSRPGASTRITWSESAGEVKITRNTGEFRFAEHLEHHLQRRDKSVAEVERRDCFEVDDGILSGYVALQSFSVIGALAVGHLVNNS